MRKVLWFLSLIWLCSCGSSSDSNTDNFNREAMLANWADNIIIPAYEDYSSKLKTQVTQAQLLVNDPTVNNLELVRESWEAAYIAWQSVEMFEIGEAELIRLQGLTNTFPANISEIEVIIESGDYNLELPSRRNQQGFPAIDYLLHGSAASDAEIAALFSNVKYQTFLMDLVNRLDELTDQVLADWKGSYRNEFVQNSGSSGTASVDKMTNDFVFYYEKFVRAAKVGIPAGVFSGSKDATTVEAFYQNDISKLLYEEGLNATQNFFDGKHFGQNTSGESFSAYLDYLRSIQGGDDIKQMILDQFVRIRNQNAGLSISLSDQVETNNAAMLQTYDALQENVVLFKVDMMQAMDIRVDYVDADGD